MVVITPTPEHPSTLYSQYTARAIFRNPGSRPGESTPSTAAVPVGLCAGAATGQEFQRRNCFLNRVSVLSKLFTIGMSGKCVWQSVQDPSLQSAFEKWFNLRNAFCKVLSARLCPGDPHGCFTPRKRRSWPAAASAARRSQPSFMATTLPCPWSRTDRTIHVEWSMPSRKNEVTEVSIARAQILPGHNLVNAF